MKIDELLLTDREMEKLLGEDFKTAYSRHIAEYHSIAKAQIEKIKNNLPTFEEIRLKIADCQLGSMEVPQLREWLKENLLIKEEK